MRNNKLISRKRPAPNRHNTVRTDAIQCEKPAYPVEASEETRLPHAGPNMFKGVYVQVVISHRIVPESVEYSEVKIAIRSMMRSAMRSR